MHSKQKITKSKKKKKWNSVNRIWRKGVSRYFIIFFRISQPLAQMRSSVGSLQFFFFFHLFHIQCAHHLRGCFHAIYRMRMNSARSSHIFDVLNKNVTMNHEWCCQQFRVRGDTLHLRKCVLIHSTSLGSITKVGWMLFLRKTIDSECVQVK